MSKERELLVRIVEADMVEYMQLMGEAEELLAQPEQEPVAWIDDGSLKSLQESTGYALRFLTNDTESLKNTHVPLYLAPPKREHIVDVTDKVEPVEERIARWHRLGYEQGKKASQRPPLTPQQISEGNQSMFNVTREAFVKGIKFAEKAHGITGGGE